METRTNVAVISSLRQTWSEDAGGWNMSIGHFSPHQKCEITISLAINDSDH